MRRYAALAAMFGALGCLAQPGPAATLSPGEFSGVNLCVPFAVKVQPGDAYSVRVDAEAPVREALKARVRGAVLQLTTEDDFSTNQPIKVTVTLPAESLASLSTLADAVVAPGFAPQKLSLDARGAGSVLARGLQAPSLAVSATGTGRVVVDESAVGTADVVATGTSSIFISEVSEGVQVRSAGVGTVVVGAANPSVLIRGSVTGTSRVLYNQGQCSVTSPFSQAFITPTNFFSGFPMPQLNLPFGSPCQQTSQIQAPQGSEPQWTCGLDVRGRFDCTGGNSFASASGTAGRGASVAASSVGASQEAAGPRVTAFDRNGPSGMQFAASASGPGFAQTISTGAGAARSIECRADPATLSMP